MKTWLKWIAWGVFGIVVALFIYESWTEKSEIEKTMLVLFSVAWYGLYHIAKILDEIKAKQLRQTELLYQILDITKNSALPLETQFMLRDFLDDKETNNLNDDNKRAL